MKNFAKFAMVGVIGIVMLAGSGVMGQVPGETLTSPEAEGCKFKFVKFTAFEKTEKEDEIGKVIPNVYNISRGNKTTIAVIEKNSWKYKKKSSERMTGASTIKDLIVQLKVCYINVTPHRVKGEFYQKEISNWVRSQDVIVIDHHIEEFTRKLVNKNRNTKVTFVIVGKPTDLQKDGPFLILSSDEFLKNPDFPAGSKRGIWKRNIVLKGDNIGEIKLESTFYGDYQHRTIAPPKPRKK